MVHARLSGSSGHVKNLSDIFVGQIPLEAKKNDVTVPLGKAV
jgi:hypothetical protein